MQDDPTENPAISYYQRRIRVGERMSLILRAYAFIGVLMTLGGSGFVLYSRLRIKLTMNEQVALAFAFMGVIMAVVSYGYLSYRKAVYERDVEQVAQHRAVGRFIEAWARFEEASREAAFGDLAEPTRTNVRETLAQLRAKQRLTTLDLVEAEDLLQLRNALVHGARKYPVEDLDEALGRLVKLLTKVS